MSQDSELARTSFEKLRIYQLAEILSDEVWKITSRWNPYARDTVGRQWVRATDSIGANIAEGDGKGSFADNRRFLRNARGSLYESKHWLRRATQRCLISAEEAAELHEQIEQLLPQLNAYLRWIENKIKAENSKP